jgi:hypothetical protein
MTSMVHLLWLVAFLNVVTSQGYREDGSGCLVQTKSVVWRNESGFVHFQRVRGRGASLREAADMSDGQFLKVFAYLIAVVVSLACANEVFGIYGGAKRDSSPMTKSRRRLLPGLSISLALLESVNNAFLIPFAYDFAGCLGASGSQSSVAFLSGLIQNIGSAGNTVGVCASSCIWK